MIFLKTLFGEKLSPIALLFKRTYYNIPIVYFEDATRFYMEWETEEKWRYAYDTYLNKIHTHSFSSKKKNNLRRKNYTKSTCSSISETGSIDSFHSNPELLSIHFLKSIPFFFFPRRSESLNQNNLSCGRQCSVSIDKIIIGAIVFQIYNRCFGDKFSYPPLVLEVGLSKHTTPLPTQTLLKRKKLYKRLEKIYFDDENILPLIGREYILYKIPDYLETFIILCIVRMYCSISIPLTKAFENVDNIPNISDYNVEIAKTVLKKWASKIV
jgi:hypothetical protein